MLGSAANAEVYYFGGSGGYVHQIGAVAGYLEAIGEVLSGTSVADFWDEASSSFTTLPEFSVNSLFRAGVGANWPVNLAGQSATIDARVALQKASYTFPDGIGIFIDPAQLDITAVQVETELSLPIEVAETDLGRVSLSPLIGASVTQSQTSYLTAINFPTDEETTFLPYVGGILSLEHDTSSTELWMRVFQDLPPEIGLVVRVANW